MPSVIRSNECVMRHKNVCLAHLGVQNAIFILDIVFFCGVVSRVESRKGKIWHNHNCKAYSQNQQKGNKQKGNKMQKANKKMQEQTKKQRNQHGLARKTGVRAGAYDDWWDFWSDPIAPAPTGAASCSESAVWDPADNQCTGQGADGTA